MAACTKKSKPPWELVCSLLERACREQSIPGDVLEPLGEFRRVPCDEEWIDVSTTASDRGGVQHLGEVIGDVLQARDDNARKNLAFCQTPGFVAEYLLDHVLVAYDIYGLFNTGETRSRRRRPPQVAGRQHAADQRIRLLDPSCGSGHLLVRAVRRMTELLPRIFPAAGVTDIEPLAWACGSVTGYELNPQAAAVARVRLAMELAASPASSTPLGQHAMGRILRGDAVQVRDSLLDPGDARYEMIVANPPYVTPKDPDQRESIRKKYVSAHGKYGLHGPFLEAMIRQWVMPRGFIMAIVSNNFMKREWGQKLIEEVISGSDLRIIVDTKGAYIPGHGTPTVILGFRGYPPCSDSGVLNLIGHSGEPGVPDDPAKGNVWMSIRGHTMRTLGAMIVPPGKGLRCTCPHHQGFREETPTCALHEGFRPTWPLANADEAAADADGLGDGVRAVEQLQLLDLTAPATPRTRPAKPRVRPAAAPEPNPDSAAHHAPHGGAQAALPFRGTPA